jgi:hypothetical protein
MAYQPDLEQWKGMRSDEIIAEVLGKNLCLPSCGRTHHAETPHPRQSVPICFRALRTDAPLGLTRRPLVVFDDNTSCRLRGTAAGGLTPYDLNPLFSTGTTSMRTRSPSGASCCDGRQPGIPRLCGSG